MEHEKRHTEKNFQEKASEILDALLDNTLSEELEEDIRNWFAELPRREEKEQALEEVFYKKVSEDPAPGRDVFLSYQSICKRLGIQAPDKPYYAVRRKTPLRRIMLRAAGVVLLLLTVTGVVYYNLRTIPVEEPVLAQVTLVVPEGKQEEVVLEDRSKVLINSGSIVRYAEEFSKHREIYLEGEAFFQVEKDPRATFYVRTKNVVIEVTGTAFNVSEYPGTGETVVSLHNGSINLTADNRTLSMQPSEELRYEHGTGTIRVDSLSTGKEWWLEPIAFTASSLGEIFSELEKRFGVTIEQDSLAFTGERLSIKFDRDDTLEEILDILKKYTMEFEYEHANDNRILIYKN